MRRDTHQLKLVFKPWDLYLWDNLRLLLGREKVLKTPGTGVGQTVPEQVVHDRYRALAVSLLKGKVGEKVVGAYADDSAKGVGQIHE